MTPTLDFLHEAERRIRLLIATNQVVFDELMAFISKETGQV